MPCIGWPRACGVLRVLRCSVAPWAGLCGFLACRCRPCQRAHRRLGRVCHGKRLRWSCWPGPLVGRPGYRYQSRASPPGPCSRGRRAQCHRRARRPGRPGRATGFNLPCRKRSSLRNNTKREEKAKTNIGAGSYVSESRKVLHYCP
ncbi:unnamed protein product [Amoebophrya sp. A120]|nr:unnamed protein product [Amoebophrya sp. A120]|eukprot:GSA120T00007012001.1